MKSVQETRNEIVLRLLKTLEYKIGDIVSYDDFLKRLGVWCKLSRPVPEDCIEVNCNLLNDSDVIQLYFKILGKGENKVD